MPEITLRKRFLKSQMIDRMRLLLQSRRAFPLVTDPLHSDIPALRNAEIAAIYRGQRVAGDFYEYMRVGQSRVLFGLFDIAGRREDTRQVLVAAQKTLRTLAPQLFSASDVNESDAMIELSQRINRTILRFEGGVRSCPAFIGCYNEDKGTVCYSNAGHTPALLRDETGLIHLEATGLPLGLFSHTTRDAYTVSILPRAILLIASLGIVEAPSAEGEFGLKGVSTALQGAAPASARDVCLVILQAVEAFMQNPTTHNDVTALALFRTPA